MRKNYSSQTPLFVPVPFRILGTKASMKAKLFMVVIYLHDWHNEGRAHPSQKRIAKLMGCTIPTVNAALKECIKLGWIKIHRQKGSVLRYRSTVRDMTADQFKKFIGYEETGVQKDLGGVPKDFGEGYLEIEDLAPSILGRMIEKNEISEEDKRKVLEGDFSIRPPGFYATGLEIWSKRLKPPGKS